MLATHFLEMVLKDISHLNKFPNAVLLGGVSLRDYTGISNKTMGFLVFPWPAVNIQTWWKSLTCLPENPPFSSLSGINEDDGEGSQVSPVQPGSSRGRKTPNSCFPPWDLWQLMEELL